MRTRYLHDPQRSEQLPEPVRDILGIFQDILEKLQDILGWFKDILG
ncbi:hypothetical protein LCGC14_0908510 [marine sediment metagenome]|uniref:Uncharacterized protein n=1 Tax=marine sediment metagenome TaxID=412755 RepID=A0A0F9RD67_9ZZZZ